ncbi:MAG: Rrf2 family transcriptional regulator [Flavobacteriaceae bacterium]
MLSNSSKYALKAVLYLAVHSSIEQKISAKDVGKIINVPQAYISKLLQELSKHGVVASMRGPGGGFYLTEGNKKVALLDIVNIIDGDNKLTSCILSLNKCDMQRPCPLHNLIGDTKIKFVNELQGTTVGDLVQDISLGKAFLPL